ncbi:MAG TPA: serine--tRNA ligase [candidate division Zixibacteria bacterium]|nr:serine--tRNA ligase [candidate division Zixibacteria bacterium]
MIDINIIRENPELVKSACANKNEPDVVDEILTADAERRALQAEGDELRHRQKELSSQVGAAFAGGDRELAEKLKAEAKALSDSVKALEEKQREAETRWSALLIKVPNIPADDVPVGDASANVILREWGSPPKFDFEPRDHIDLGDMLGMLDMELGAKVAGSGFSLLAGDGARMSRALIAMMLDIHRESGFLEIAPPFLANRQAMTGTAQIPKLEGDMYHFPEEDLFLIPTAEVPITNLHAGEMLREENLPIYYAGYTANFRREAGSYGADTRGLLRVHQFDKVELVKFSHPDKSWEEHESLLAQAEKVLQALELHYRVVLLATGDMSFASAKVYDIELWAPGEGRWLEVSSCSNFLDFQSRRANIRFRPESGGQVQFVHTLNASGVALPRLLVAIWESYQTARGTVQIPRALRPYMHGQEEISPRL